MAYRGRSGWAALGAGLSSLGALAEKSQAEARKEQLDNAERDLRMRTLKAREMAEPGAMSLESALPALNERALASGDPNASALTPQSLSRIGDASDTGASIDFRAPAPITKSVNGQQITVRDSAPFLTGTGVVEDPRGAREQAMGASDLAYATTQERAQIEANRQGDLLAAAGVDAPRVAAIRARVPAGSVDDLFRQPSAMERMPMRLQMKQARVNNLREQIELLKRGLKDPGLGGSDLAMAEYERGLGQIRSVESALAAAIADLNSDQEDWLAANPRGGVTPKPVDDGSGRVGMTTNPEQKPYVYARPEGSYPMPPNLGVMPPDTLPQPALGNISAMVNRGKVAPPSTPTPTLAPPRAGMAAPPDTASVGPPAPVAPVPPPAPAAAPASVTTPTATLNTNDPVTARATAQKLQAQGKTPAEIMQIMNAAGFRVKHRGQP